jgi:putative nucleotidyltransferase with HDIG domain
MLPSQSGSIEINDVMELFPELLLITDSELRIKCINVLVEAYSLGGWDKSNAESCPVSLRITNEKLRSQIKHVHSVTKIALAIYDTLEDIYENETKLRDYVIAGALLHDAGKMMEFKFLEGAQLKDGESPLIRHPLSGAILAAKHQLPEEIIHLIANHSFEGKDSKKTLVSTIVNHADSAAFSYIVMNDKIN